jgi:hypothetical protein
MTLLELPDILQERIQPEPNSGCWLWTGRLIKGYGILLHDDKMHQGHRLVYELLKGTIPPGLQLDHLCRTPACVNPDHLEPVTPRENVRRGKVSELRVKLEYCKNGHPLNGENLRLKPRNDTGQLRRVCRICNRKADIELWRKRKLESTGLVSRSRSERKLICPAGHSKTGENLVITARGCYICRLCRIISAYEQNNRKHADDTKVYTKSVVAMNEARREIGSKTRLYLLENYGKGVMP